jgi:hypothetical protein
MSDNLRRYRAIRDALTQGYPGQPTGQVARHLTTLAAMISGIVGSKSTQLPHIAMNVPDGTQSESTRHEQWGSMSTTNRIITRWLSGFLRMKVMTTGIRQNPAGNNMKVSRESDCCTLFGFRVCGLMRLLTGAKICYVAKYKGFEARGETAAAAIVNLCRHLKAHNII